MKKRSCECPICQTEQELTLSLEAHVNEQSFRKLASSFPVLNCFSTTLDLLGHLHRRDFELNELKSLDKIFACLVRGYGNGSHDGILSLLLTLTFIPTLHKTYREVCVAFPALSPDDIAQQLLTALFLVLRSRSVRNRSSHVAVAVSRLVRTNVLRWAARQTREVSECEPLETLDEEALERLADGNSEISRTLRDFLHDCRRIGALPNEDYDLLLKVKLEGFEAKELAGLDGGPSAMAIHQRIHRIMDRLRRRASR